MRRPNILLILADDMGYGDLSSCNQGRSDTPVLDELARTGTALTQHYSASPVCAPARASLLTGRYPHRTGAIDTLEARGLDRLALTERTLGDLMTEAGYLTGLIGKWHNGALDDRYHPNRRGFREFVGFRGGWSDYWDWRLEANGAPRPADGRYLTDVLTDEAVSFVRRHRDDTWFLHVAYSAPHYPLQALQGDLDHFAGAGLTPGVAHIYAMVRAMDRGIGRILVELARQGLEEETLVMFSSDNGPQFGGAGDMNTTRFNCGYKGAKGFVYEGGVRLPMLLRWPGGLPSPAAGQDGRRLDELVHFTDWLPTLLAVAGATCPPELAVDGVDVSPLLRGEGGSVPAVRFWQWNRYTPIATVNAAMRDGRWKLVRPAVLQALLVPPDELARDEDVKRRPEAYAPVYSAPFPDVVIGELPASQLFDIDADPAESEDQAAVHPGRVARMEDALARWFEDVEEDRKRATRTR